VKAYSIADAWREVMVLAIQNGNDYVVERGSCNGQIRKQLPYVQIVIDHPEHRPLSPIMPPGIPGPTDEDKISSYFARYIMSDELAENEVYTYGQFITKQIDRIIELLNSSRGNTNQATIAIGDVSTTFLDDPPCLRTVSFKVIDGKLDMSVYFRSWDLYAGLPENLGGLQLLKEYVISNLTFPCEPGRTIAFSDGLHIYEMYEGVVNTLNCTKLKFKKTEEKS